MRRPRPRRLPREAGYSMVALLAAIAIMMILMAAAVPSWRYVMKNDAEEELIFRGGEIADAIVRYQRKNGNALPPSMEALVKGRHLRRPYKDPITRREWRLVRPGEAIAASVTPPGAGSPAATTTTTTTTTTRPSAFAGGGLGGVVAGGFQGVASTSTDTSLRVFNGRTRYSEWLFLAGQPRVVGRPLVPQAGSPFARPSPGRPTPTPGLRR